jgi:DNA-binding GntR family transcriptional regulator
MLDSWMARDLERVTQLTRAHIEQTLEDLRRQLVSGREKSEPE